MSKLYYYNCERNIWLEEIEAYNSELLRLVKQKLNICLLLLIMLDGT